MLIIDSHTHLGHAVTDAKSTEKGLISEMDKAGVSKSVVFPTKTLDRGKQYSQMNKKIIEFYKKHPERIIPFIRLEPGFSKKELSNYPEARGVKIHIKADNWTNGFLHKALSLIEETELVVIFHSDRVIIKRIFPVIKDFNKIKFIAAHGIRSKEYLEAFKTQKNLFFDSSIKMSPFTMKVLCAIDENRILFGSDYPFSFPSIEKKRVEMAPIDYLTQEQREKILGLNAKKLFKL